MNCAEFRMQFYADDYLWQRVEGVEGIEAADSFMTRTVTLMVHVRLDPLLDLRTDRNRRTKSYSCGTDMTWVEAIFQFCSPIGHRRWWIVLLTFGPRSARTSGMR